jgi:hypothetical protein
MPSNPVYPDTCSASPGCPLKLHSSNDAVVSHVVVSGTLLDLVPSYLRLY